MSSNSKVNLSDLVAVWEIALSDGVHKVEFEHGTTSGKRVVYVDGKVMLFFYQSGFGVVHFKTVYLVKRNVL